MKLIPYTYIIGGIVFAIIFLLKIDFPVGLEGYFQRTYYMQFGGVALAVEMGLAGYYLLRSSNRANFMLALFGFSVVLDIVFGLIGVFSSILTGGTLWVFGLIAFESFVIAFSNQYNTGKIAVSKVVISFLLGTAFELFFNYYL